MALLRIRFTLDWKPEHTKLSHSDAPPDHLLLLAPSTTTTSSRSRRDPPPLARVAPSPVREEGTSRRAAARIPDRDAGSPPPPRARAEHLGAPAAPASFSEAGIKGSGGGQSPFPNPLPNPTRIHPQPLPEPRRSPEPPSPTWHTLIRVLIVPALVQRRELHLGQERKGGLQRFGRSGGQPEETHACIHRVLHRGAEVVRELHVEGGAKRGVAHVAGGGFAGVVIASRLMWARRLVRALWASWPGAGGYSSFGDCWWMWARGPMGSSHRELMTREEGALTWTCSSPRVSDTAFGSQADHRVCGCARVRGNSSDAVIGALDEFGVTRLWRMMARWCARRGTTEAGVSGAERKGAPGMAVRGRWDKEDDQEAGEQEGNIEYSRMRIQSSGGNSGKTGERPPRGCFWRTRGHWGSTVGGGIKGRLVLPLPLPSALRVAGGVVGRGVPHCVAVVAADERPLLAPGRLGPTQIQVTEQLGILGGVIVAPDNLLPLAIAFVFGAAPLKIVGAAALEIDPVNLLVGGGGQDAIQDFMVGADVGVNDAGNFGLEEPEVPGRLGALERVADASTTTMSGYEAESDEKHIHLRHCALALILIDVLDEI
ncbi:hypothetical protein DFH07DRAFT_976808 [Mycena maculata]|uniref:Uncharacterized protein n=1 Tax=Mycena maculata TaxID=230809 RepID=A0AAD7K3R8_9AGAR|nr:hypothetical protein DFH07DRAFT_976808 [Mycena maculata]